MTPITVHKQGGHTKEPSRQFATGLQMATSADIIHKARSAEVLQ